MCIMEAQLECCLCGRQIRRQKYDLNIRDNAYYVGNFQLILDLKEVIDSTKVCPRCYNKNRELNKRTQVTPGDFPIPMKKKKDSNEIRDKYFVETSTVEELTQILLGNCKCGGKWVDSRLRGHGSILGIDIYCQHGHNTIWSSSRILTQPIKTSHTVYHFSYSTPEIVIVDLALAEHGQKVDYLRKFATYTNSPHIFVTV